MISRRRVADSFVLVVMLIAVLALPACSVNVKKGENDQEKNVDISTPVGAIHVSKNADVKDTGMSLYPGARPMEKDGDKEEKSANVHINSPLFGLRVVAQQYQSDDAPDKLISYYSNELKKYGNVLECRTTWRGGDVRVHTGQNKGSDKESKELTCDNDHGGKAVELKVGTEDHQHLVAIEPDGKGSKFALVYVDVHSKDDTI
jgi:hypothetical protein